MKKVKKGIISLGEISLVSAGTGMAVSRMGYPLYAGGVANVARFAPAMGSVMGVAGTVRLIKRLQPKKK